MRPVIERLRIFAQENETLLLTGSTGAGKSRLARWCHEQSPRRSGPFERVQLLGIPEELQLGELFGWRRGAFTGAVRDHMGSIARARGGTLFIDEIDKLSLRAQASLLEFLDERRYRVLGETGREHAADVRIIVGTNADLHETVRHGQFREDLYYRIHVLVVRVPPLSERSDEIGAWARWLLERSQPPHPRGPRVRLTVEAETLLSQARWPGNLRQLDNVVRRARSLARLSAPGDGGELLVNERHVRDALALEREGEDEAWTLLERAATAFVREAGRRPPGQVTFALADAFRSLILDAAARAAGSKEAAFLLLGEAAMVRRRNHHRVWRREMIRLEQLRRVLSHRDADRELWQEAVSPGEGRR